MMDRHPLSIEGRPIPFRAVDDANTSLREDAFAFREMPYGFDLYIGSIVPPTLFVDRSSLAGILRLAVNKQKFRQNFWSSSSYDGIMNARGLSLFKPSLSVVVRYRVSETLGIQSLDVSAGMLKLGYILNIEEYVQAGYTRTDSQRIKPMLDELYSPQDSFEQKKMGGSTGRGQTNLDIREGMSTLFNHACMSAAQKERIPFVGLVKKLDENRLELFPSRAVFSRSLRDPLGFINLLNLSHVLLGKPPLFPKETLLGALPRAFLKD